MVRLTKQQLKYYSRFDNRIFKSFKVNRNDLYLNGSYSFTHNMLSLWAGDIDLYSPLKWSNIDKVINELKQLKGNRLIHIYNVEYDDNGVSLDTFLNTSQTTIIKSMKQQDNPMIFVESWVYTGYIEEVSILYDIGGKILKLQPQEVANRMIDDIKDLQKDRKYFKILKRLDVIYDELGLKKKQEEVEQLIKNPDVGFLYLTITRLKSLLLPTVPLNLKNRVIDRLKNDVRKLGLIKEVYQYFNVFNSVHVKKVIHYLENELNRRVVKIVKSHV